MERDPQIGGGTACCAVGGWAWAARARGGLQERGAAFVRDTLLAGCGRYPIIAPFDQLHAEAVATLRARMAPDAFAAATQRGEQADLTEMIDVILSVDAA